jgi:hypothetical protein
MMLEKCVLVAAAWLVVSSCWAGKKVEEAKLSQNVSGKDFDDPQRLTAYEENYAVWNQMRNNGWTTKDEQALRAKISFKYTFCGKQFRRPTEQARLDTVTLESKRQGSWCPASGKWADAELYFGYSGEFDFYAGTRPSGPVIGRVNAPGFFVRLPATLVFDQSWKPADGLELGVQHRSDGQTTHVMSDRDARVAKEQYAAGNRPFFDTISRGANFFLVAVDKELEQPPWGEKLTLRAKLRLYLGQQDSDITWGPLANGGRRFSDYDRLQLQAWWRFSPETQVDLAWRLGDRGLATDSWTLGLEVHVANVPLYLRLHRGPMNTLSNYAQRQDSIGIGVRFASF